jgi:hypothetical protein
MYKVWMTNFGYIVYEGRDNQLAREEAEMSGFECSIYTNDVLTETYSPITGWRKSYNSYDVLLDDEEEEEQEELVYDEY